MKDGARLTSILLWWTAFLLVLSTDAFWFENTSPLIPVSGRSLLAQSRGWQIPLACATDSLAWSAVPFWLLAIGGASLIFATCRMTAMHRSPSLAAILLVGASLNFAEDQLIAALLIFAGSSMTTRCRQWRRQIRTAFIIAIVAVCTTLEFGLVIIGLLCAVSRPPNGTLNRHDNLLHPPSVSFCLLFSTAVLLATFHPFFRAALLRPISWIWLNTTLMPSIRGISGSFEETIVRLPLATAILLAIWQTLRTGRVVSIFNVLNIGIAALGLSCSRYTLGCAVLLCSLPLPSDGPSDQPKRPSLRTAWSLWMSVGCLMFAATFWSVRLATEGVNAIGGSSQPAVVDPSLWRFRGPVMLFNRDQAKDWQRPDLRENFPLLVNDRWDIPAADLEQYHRAVVDLRHGRRDHYLRSDHTFGGFRSFLEQHNPVAIVIDSHDVATIRHLSVESDWRVMSIDGRRTIFGRTESAATRFLTRQTGKLLVQLEWPRQHQQMSLSGSVALGLPEDSRRVAHVLSAMRLPYAGLRVLSADKTPATEDVRAWCYLELAYRAIRHIGQPSLLDQARAAVRFRQIDERFLKPTDSSWSADKILTRLSEEADAAKLGTLTDPLSEAERDVRWALTTGDLLTASVALKRLADVHTVPFFQTLIDAADGDSLNNARDKLQAVISSHQLPARLQSESLFYSGCLALEAGHTLRAVDDFAACVAVNKDSQFVGLAMQYLSQLR